MNRLESLGSQRKAFGPPEDWEGSARGGTQHQVRWEAKTLGGFLSTNSNGGHTDSLKENFLTPDPSRHIPSEGMINTLQQSLLSN